MSYKKDSRMGDEIFAIGATIAPFAIRFIKQIYKKIARQEEIDDALTEEQKKVIEKMNLKNNMNMCKYFSIIYSFMVLLALVRGDFSLFHIVTLSILIGIYLYKTKKYKEF